MNPPASPQAELAVIGCCLLGGLDTTTDAVERLSTSDFTREDCQAGFAVLESLSSHARIVDLVSFASEWPKLHKFAMPSELISSPDQVPSAANLEYYVNEIIDSTRRRRLMFAAHDVLKNAQDLSNPVDGVIAGMESAMSGEEINSVKICDGRQCSIGLVDHLEQRFVLSQAGKKSGLITGFSNLDYLTDGLQFGEQTIIAARPSVGKTAIGMNIVERVCLQDQVPTLVCTLEMSATALSRRLLSSWGRVGMRTLKSGVFTPADHSTFVSFTSLMRRSPLYILDGIAGIDINRISAAIRRMCRKHGIKLVVIDYLQKIRASGKFEKRTYEVADVSSTLKATAVQTGAAFLTLAQLNREPDKDKTRLPRLTDLADSAQIERDGDTIALLHRPRDPGDDALLIIAKQRDGEIGTVRLDYDGRYCRFTDPTKTSTP